jgi:pimeloyl-ACP methyl ester carboxylesterase
MINEVRRIAMTGRWSHPRNSWHGNTVFREIALKARDGLHVSGWTGCAENGVSSSKGTVIMGHGFMIHSRACGGDEWGWMLRGAGYNVVAVDFRNHGNSGVRGLPAFGLPESWDLEAGLAFAAGNYPGPHMLFGSSMAGMAAQLLVQRDARVSAAVLTITPASARIALNNNLLGKIPVLGTIGTRGWAEVLKLMYGGDMIGGGDVLKLDMHPVHEPDILYISGGRDMFGEHETRKVFHNWYPCAPGYDGGVRTNGCDFQGHNGRKFYLLYPEGGHGENMPWHDINTIVMRFFDRVAERRMNHGRFIAEAYCGNFRGISNLMSNVTLDELKFGNRKETSLLWPVPLQDDWFAIQNADTGKRLGVNSGETHNGSRIVEQEACEGSDCQAWRPILCEDRSFSIQNKAARRCLDLDLDSGKYLQLWDNWFGTNQRWKLV